MAAVHASRRAPCAGGDTVNQQHPEAQLEAGVRASRRPEAAPAGRPEPAPGGGGGLVSVTVPIFNEAGNIPELYARIRDALDRLGRKWEQIGRAACRERE